MRRSLFALTMLCLALCFIEPVAAGDGGKPEAEAVEKSGESFGAWLKDKLNPSQICPHCGRDVLVNRSILMLIIGFVGQALFTSRFIVQWIASERRKESYIPVVFWYLSIAGSVLLLSYAISIKAWPIILGQCFGTVVYARNLALIARSRNAENDDAAGEAQALEEMEK